MSVVDGRQLKAGRILIKMSINEMARRAGLHRNSVTNVENKHLLPFHVYAAKRMESVLRDKGVKFSITKTSIGVHIEANTKQKLPLAYRK